MWVSDSTWVLVDSYKYDSFWNLVWEYTSAIGNTRLFTGREFDVETGLYYNRARYYAPELWRFISRDPIDVGDDVSLYRYVGNNPLIFSDPMGMEKVLVVWFTGKQHWYIWKNFYWWDKTEHLVWRVVPWKYVDSWISDIIEKLNKEKWYDTMLYYSDHWDSTWIKPALNNIKENRNKYDKLVIIWHSLWWDNAVVLSNYLDKEEIGIDLLITMDIKSIFENDTIRPNVKEAINYYQTNNFLTWEDLEKSFFNNNTNIKNIKLNNFNWKKITHKNIDNNLVDKVYNLITK